MKDTFDNVIAATAAASGIVGLMILLVRVVRWGHRVLRQLDRVIIIWQGDPTADEDDEARHGLIYRLRTTWRKIEIIEQAQIVQASEQVKMNTRLDRIEGQLTKNGGSSLADAVDRIAKNQGVPGVGDPER